VYLTFDGQSYCNLSLVMPANRLDDLLIDSFSSHNNNASSSAPQVSGPFHAMHHSAIYMIITRGHVLNYLMKSISPISYYSRCSPPPQRLLHEVLKWYGIRARTTSFRYRRVLTCAKLGCDVTYLYGDSVHSARRMHVRWTIPRNESFTPVTWRRHLSKSACP
jgi:hypothetical protein